MAAVIDINAKTVMQTFTFRVRGLKGLRARIWLASHLFGLAVWVAGGNLELEIESRQPPSDGV